MGDVPAITIVRASKAISVAGIDPARGLSPPAFPSRREPKRITRSPIAILADQGIAFTI
jgi:hypothetical protein